MHDVAPFRVSSKDIGDDLAKSAGEQSFVYVPYGMVYIFLGRRYPAGHIS